LFHVERIWSGCSTWNNAGQEANVETSVLHSTPRVFHVKQLARLFVLC
jgi:hypothetical protein